MCGVAGIFSLNGRKIENAKARIEKMTGLLHHRGPDGQGVYLSDDGFIVLGNTRLAIVDPHTKVKQPMQTSDGKTILSFNGEIYNFPDLKNELIGRGIHFKTNTDTEVLLEGLREFSEDYLLNKMDGMWAFAHYDVTRKRLLISRDLLGERHMFFHINDGELIFASEVKPIMAALPDKKFEIDFESFLTSLQYFSPPPGRTMIKGIQRLLPAHNIEALVGGDIRFSRYRKLHPEKWFDFFKADPTLDQTIELFEKMYYSACKKRLPEDVPYISTLSGGIDSTLTCIYASDFGKKEINTLYGQSSSKPPLKMETDLDELTASNLTAEKLHTKHIHIYLNNHECVPVLKELSENAFDGMFDSGVASFEMLAHHARKVNNKVMLIADGPDEMLGGYIIDRNAYQIDQLRKTDPIKYQSLKLCSSIKQGRDALRRLGFEKWIISPVSSYDPFHFVPVHSSWSPDEMTNVLNWEQITKSASHYGINDPSYKDLYPELDYAQMRALSYANYTLPDMFNLRLDKAFMRASVEARVPYQAAEMIELMIAMPSKYRFNDGKDTKYILRKIVERHIGPQISRRSKYGFGAPIWKSPNVVQAMKYDEVVADSPIFKEFNFKKGAREHVMKHDQGDMLWPFYVLAKTLEILK